MQISRQNSGLIADFVIANLEKTVVMHDTECPNGVKVSLNYTKLLLKLNSKILLKTVLHVENTYITFCCVIKPQIYCIYCKYPFKLASIKFSVFMHEKISLIRMDPAQLASVFNCSNKIKVNYNKLEL